MSVHVIEHDGGLREYRGDRFEPRETVHGIYFDIYLADRHVGTVTPGARGIWTEDPGKQHIEAAHGAGHHGPL